MAVSRCSRSSRDLFIFILCVACLSVLFNFQISYYGSTLVDQQQPLDEVLQDQVVRERTGRYDVKILGRSLNQHQGDLLRSRSTERFELLTKLNEVILLFTFIFSSILALLILTIMWGYKYTLLWKHFW